MAYRFSAATHFTPGVKHDPLSDPEHLQVRFLGIDVQILRNDTTGELNVHINTEKIREYDQKDGCPKINISLNDGDIYHDMGDGPLITDSIASITGIKPNDRDPS